MATALQEPCHAESLEKRQYFAQLDLGADYFCRTASKDADFMSNRSQ
jgi:hypothetical protein